LKQERIEDDLKDALSLKRYEIAGLKEVIDPIMNLNRNRIGYFV
jgi:hypothetical protein